MNTFGSVTNLLVTVAWLPSHTSHLLVLVSIARLSSKSCCRAALRVLFDEYVVMSHQIDMSLVLDLVSVLQLQQIITSSFSCMKLL